MDNPIKASIIVPVFNNLTGLQKCLKAVLNQTHVLHSYEIIVIDNGSTDDIKSYIEGLGCRNIHFLEEKVYLISPYSARNRGLEMAKGDVLIFLDTSCQVNKKWLNKGIDALEKADLIGGDVRFDVTKRSSIAELYDSFFNIQMKDSVIKRKLAKTCNLFVKRAVFEHIGFFKEGVRSGEDVRWSSEASKRGFNLVFSEEAYVIMKARTFKSLVGKQFRVAKGQPRIWRQNNMLKKNILNKVILCWLPPNPLALKSKAEINDIPLPNSRFMQLFLLGWLLRFVNGCGNMVGLFKR